MTNYNFDRIIDRSDTASIKYDFKGMKKPEDVIPLWIADMDFKVADPIIQALKKEAEFGVFGYNGESQGYFDAVKGWFSRRFGWEPRKEWLVKTPGVVFAFSVAIKAFSAPDDGILIQPPVYYPFRNAIKSNGRRRVENPLVLRDGRYEIDFDDFENKIREEHVKLFILCSPHNPAGRVWEEDELRRMGEICKRHNVIIVADEIHCDFVWPGKKHHMILELCPDLADIVISCTAPSKTFNLAGMQASNIWIPNEDLRKKYQNELDSMGFHGLSNFAYVACEAAYRDSEGWFNECLEYMKGNLDYIRSYLKENLPMIRLIEPEGTYFAWLDFSGLGMDRETLDDFILNKAKLWVDEGHIFGTGGDGFQRILLAVPRATLEQAMSNLKATIDESR